MTSRDGQDEVGKIFVGGIARDVDEGILTSYFSQFGNVSLATVMRDKFGISRGFGFVAFDPSDVARDVLRKVHVIEGRTIEIKQAVKHERVYASGGSRGSGNLPSNGVVVPGASPVPADKDVAIFVPRQVYVGGLPYHITEKEVREYFEQFGPVVSANLKYDFGQNPPKFRGFGFVNFVEEDSVERALENYSSHQLSGKWIEVKRSKHSHVVQGENSGVIMPQMAQGSGSGRGGAYEGGRAPAYQDPYGGAATRDPYGGGQSSGPVRGGYRSQGGPSRYSSASAYVSAPYGTGSVRPSQYSDSYNPPAQGYGSSAQQSPPYGSYGYKGTGSAYNQPNPESFPNRSYGSDDRPVASRGDYDPYNAPSAMMPNRPPAYPAKSGGWRSQQPMHHP